MGCVKLATLLLTWRSPEEEGRAEARAAARKAGVNVPMMEADEDDDEFDDAPPKGNRGSYGRPSDKRGACSTVL